MFDRTFVMPGRTRTEYVTREVHEHRAPTDESVKLLREMEQAADAKRIASMQMPGNTFSGVVESWFNGPDWTTHLQAVFDLNGRRMTVAVYRRADADPMELVKELHQKVAEKIAAEMLTEMTRGLKLLPR